MKSIPNQKIYDVIIIGGGQSALACGYYLRRTDLEYVILDNQENCGGAWQHAWKSLNTLFPSRTQFFTRMADAQI